MKLTLKFKVNDNLNEFVQTTEGSLIKSASNLHHVKSNLFNECHMVCNATVSHVS